MTPRTRSYVYIAALCGSVSVPYMLVASGKDGKDVNAEHRVALEAAAKTRPDAGWRTVLRNDAVTPLDSGEPGVRLSRKIISAVDRSGLGLRLYQFGGCPYCCKVRAFLDYYGFSYEVVEVHPVTKSALKWTGGYKKVPVLRSVCCDKPLVDSSQIISMLATFLVQDKLTFDKVPDMYTVEMEPVRDQRELGKKSAAPKQVSPHQYFVMYGEIPMTTEQIQLARNERHWRQWVDDTFIHLISPNIYQGMDEALNAFSEFSRMGDWQDNFNWFERKLARYTGAPMMWAISRRLKKRHGIENERLAMRDAIRSWLAEKGPHQPFMGGSHPGLDDLAFYGACKSFAFSWAFAEMCIEFSEFRFWYNAMEKAVQEGQGRVVLERKCRALEQQRQQKGEAVAGWAGDEQQNTGEQRQKRPRGRENFI